MTTPRRPGPAPDRGPTPAQWALVGITVALAAGALTYRALHESGLAQSSALFVGLPAVIAICVALTPKARTATGMVVKAISLGLLLSGVLLGEGIICIVMAAPLFFAIGIPVGLAVDASRGRQEGPGPKLTVVVLAPLLVLSMVEGVTPATTLPSHAAATAERRLEVPPEAVEAALASTPAFGGTVLPAYLRLGFPRPIGAEGGGLDLGDERVITFATPSGPAPLILRVAAREAGFVRFEVVEDRTPVAGWLALHHADVRWRGIPGGATVVTWTLDYDRLLSPAWYFGPWERYATGLAAGYLIDTVATPGPHGR
ncbi:MAG: hypothetical protein ACR2K0_00225 [Acidimicrobiales bacterium]